MLSIRTALEGLGYTIPPSRIYKNIEIWKSWYMGYNPKFHDYLQYNGQSKIKRTRKSLRMGKKVCEDHANLLMNEKVQILLNNPQIEKYVSETLVKNKFRVQANKLVERAFALGSGAFVEHSDGNGGVTIDYVRADMIFPLLYDGDTITDCAFGSIINSGNKEVIYLNIHKLESTGYVISNHLIPRDGVEKIVPDEKGLLPGELASKIETGSTTPRFQIIGPNTANNIDLDSPLGISVYANSIDLLKSIDLVYDSYDNEFRLGKKRVLISGALAKININPLTQEIMPVFDDNDTEFYALPEFDNNTKPIYEINMELRAEAHEAALQRFLNLLSDKCGLGSDRYIFERGTAKTATEVISEKSELYQNLKKNELVLEEALKGMCKAIAEIGGYKDTFEVTVKFDDSIIEDEAAKRSRIQMLVSQGKFPLWRYLMEFEGYNEEDARDIAAEAESSGEVITFTEPGA